MNERQDAYGRLVLDHLEGRHAVEVIERDDGFMEATAGPAGYFAPVRRWPACERRALRLVRGRALDVGVGAAASRSSSSDGATRSWASTCRRSPWRSRGAEA